MIPNIYTLLKNVSAVQAELGNPVRIYGWGEAPQNTPMPYATYYCLNAVPENTQDKTPQVDNVPVQIDIFGTSATECEKAAIAIRDALEVNNHMTSFSNPLRDAQTKAYHARLDFDIFNFRSL